MSVIDIKDSEDLKAKLIEAGDRLVVLDFFATWCGPCKMISPELKKLAEANTNVLFYKVNVDECEDLAAEYNVNSMPTFTFIKKGVKVFSFSGANLAALVKAIEEHKN